MTKKTAPQAPIVRQLAIDLITRKEAGQEPGTVLLGAGASVTSGIPAWASLAKQIWVPRCFMRVS